MANYLREFSTESAYTEATLNYPSVSLIDENGTVHFDQTAPITPKWVARYSDSSVASAECDSTSAITYLDGLENDNTLIEVEIGDCVTSIGYGAFAECRSLSSITISDSVETIDESAFAYCTSLTGITIPDSVTTIGDDVFWGCSNMAAINILSTTPPSIVDSFNGTWCWIYVPAEAVDTYKEEWPSYSNRIQAIPNN